MFYCTIRWGTFFAARFGADMQWPVGSSPWRPTWRKSCNLASYIPSLEMWINPCLEKKLLKVCQTFLMIHFSIHPTSEMDCSCIPWVVIGIIFVFVFVFVFVYVCFFRGELSVLTSGPWKVWQDPLTVQTVLPLTPNLLPVYLPTFRQQKSIANCFFICHLQEKTMRTHT